MPKNHSNSTKLHTPYLMRYQLTGYNYEHPSFESYRLKDNHSFANSSPKAVDVKYFQFFVSGRIYSSVLVRANSWHELHTDFRHSMDDPYVWIGSAVIAMYSTQWQFRQAELDFWIPTANDSSPANHGQASPGASLQAAVKVSPAKSADFTIKLHKVTNILWGDRLKLLLLGINCGYMYSPHLVMFKCHYFHQSGHVPFRVQTLPYAGFI